MALEDLSNEQLEAELEDLQRRVERLRVLYEQYFLGIEKTPPYNVQKDVVRIIHRLTHVRIHSTTLKYRLQGLIQRFNSHKSYWARTVRDIEEGRFKRPGVRARSAAVADGLTPADHAAIAAIRDAQGEDAAAEALRRRQAKREAEADVAENFLRQLQGLPDPDDRPASSTPASSAPTSHSAPAPGAAANTPVPASSGTSTDPGVVRGVSADDLAARAAKLRELRDRMARGGDASASLNAAIEAARAARTSATSGATVSPQAAAAAPRPAPAAAAPPRPATPDPARQVFEKLVATKRQLNESTDGLNYETLRRTMERQADVIREKKGCRSVDFDVVVKDGKAFLKPIVRD